MSDGWNRFRVGQGTGWDRFSKKAEPEEAKPSKYDPSICEQIKSDIEATCHERIDDRIEDALRLGDAWRAESLRQIAKQDFIFMVATNGECPSIYADVREAFTQFSESGDPKPYDARAELEKRFYVTTNPETGAIQIHPKGMR